MCGHRGFYLIAAMGMLVPVSALGEVWEFQQGLNGYEGTLDTYLHEVDADMSHGEEDLVMVDGLESTNSREQGLLWFQDIFQPNGPVPADPGQINKATLYLTVQNPGFVDWTMHRMLGPWGEDDTWNMWGDGQPPHNSAGGVQADDYEAMSTWEEYECGSGAPEEVLTIDVTASLQAWASSPEDNFGWVFLAGENHHDGWLFHSSEASPISVRPRLVIPEPAGLLLLAVGAALSTTRRR